jgi:uncharacterized cupredoxin-like copper-binding protein
MFRFALNIVLTIIHSAPAHSPSLVHTPMKKTISHQTRSNLLKSIGLWLCFCFAISSCQNQSKEQTEEKADSVALVNPTQPQLNSDQLAVLQSILGNAEAGVIRGITFGDDIAKVKATETIEMFEETPDHLGYTFETPQRESVDIQYFLNSEKKINKIQIDVYLNSGEATSQLWDAGKKHFTEVYATPKEENKTLVWSKNAVKVQMEDVTAGKDYGLKFVFHPTKKNALAAN